MTTKPGDRSALQSGNGAALDYPVTRGSSRGAAACVSITDQNGRNGIVSLELALSCHAVTPTPAS